MTKTDNPRPCDKCGRPVPADNDAVRLAIILGAGPHLITARPRHLLATDNCPGSPSRAQYLEGQPRDERSDYPLVEKHIPIIRAAYAELLEIAKEYQDR